MANVFDLFAVLHMQDDGFKKGMQEAEKSTDGLTSKLGKLGSGLATIAKAGTAAMVGLGTAAAGVAKKSVDAYAETEQLRGGIETLFGKDAQQMLMNADKAFQTAGMSANEYMETAIQSSASMINSLNGDTKKAAELTDLAIRDMSDSVNKMGTSMESIQNAYRGFSRGNFTINNLMSVA